MTLYTHAVVGLGLAHVFAVRCRRPALYYALAALLPVLPDFDVFSTATYGDMLGHRGWTHSLMFAMWVGFFVASLTFRYLRANLWALTGIFFLVTASHGILDAFTRGGFAIPFLWPLENSRYGNWGPVPVADIAFEIPDPRQSLALRGELVWVWLPTALIAGLVTTCRYFRSRAGDPATPPGQRRPGPSSPR